jgi:hypothetical protein
MTERNSLMYSDVLGFDNGSRSLAGRDTAINPLRLYPLSGVETTEGDSLTWGALKKYGREWGISQDILYSTVQTGYTYVWNLTTNTFTVTDADGNITTYTNCKDPKDLRVSWGVFTSAQFYIKLLDGTNNAIFLIGTHPTRGGISILNTVGQFMYNNFLEDGDIHAVFDQLASYSAIDSAKTYTSTSEEAFSTKENTIIGAICDPETFIPTILISKADNLQSTNLYPIDVSLTDEQLNSTRTLPERNSHSYQAATYLMIALFAQNLLSSDTDIVYEPWLLWAAYQWYFNTVHTTTNSRQIFDLSPGW